MKKGESSWETGVTFEFWIVPGTESGHFKCRYSNAIGWFLLVDPPVDSDSVSMRRTDQDWPWAFTERHTTSQCILHNWNLVQQFLCEDEVLDNMILGCYPLVFDFISEEEVLNVSLDVKEYYDVVEDEYFTDLIKSWYQLHQTVEKGDGKRLRTILEDMINHYGGGMPDEDDVESFHHILRNNFENMGMEDTWSEVMCGQFEGEVFPDVREFQKNILEEAQNEKIHRHQEYLLSKRYEPFWYFVWSILFILFANIYVMLPAGGALQCFYGIVTSGILLATMGHFVKEGKILP